MQIPTDTAVLRDGRVLLGFMSEEEAQAYVTSQAAESWDEVRERWRAARQIVEGLEPTTQLEPPELLDLPSELAPRAGNVRLTSVFQRSFANRSPDFKLVEIAKLVAFQQFIDTQFATESAPPNMAADHEVFDYCIPNEFTANLAFGIDVPNAAVNISSLSRNVNLEGIEIQQQPDQPLKVAFAIGARANWVQVAEFEGRYFLKNGYHRVWQLRQAGRMHTPAIVTTATSIEDVGAGPGFFPAALILSERPPMFRYFGEESLAPTLSLKSTLKVIRLKGEEFVLPRLP